MSKKKFTGSISGKGYYIALILCAAAIGISGYLYYRTNKPDDAQVLADPSGQGVEAVATRPGQNPPDSSGNPQNTPTHSGGSQGSGQKPAGVVRPVEGQTLSGYAMDHLTYNPTTRDWRVHDGVDLAAEAGADVVAAADGTVYTVYEDEAMGMTVVVRHDGGYTTRYASLAAEVPVEAGDAVTAGQVLGQVGSTALMESAVGDHVHFSVSCNGETVDPMDWLE